MQHDPYSQGGAFGQAPGVGWAPGAPVFRGLDTSLPAFRPAGSGGFAAKWVAIAAYLAAFAVPFAVGILSAAAGSTGEDGLLPLLVLVPLSVYFLACVTWIYQSWAFLPEEMRRTASGRAIGPGEAVGGLFLPLYNLYWMFVIAPGLCEAVNAAQAQTGRAPSAPRQLAMAAVVVQLIPYINWLVGPVLWIVYMFLVDRAKEELAGRR